MPLLVYAARRLLNKEYTPRNADGLLTCLGRYEKFYNTDVTIDYCDTTVESSWQRFVCSTTHILLLVIMSNSLEAYFLWKCIQVNNSQTKDVKSLLSLSTYKRRQR